MYGSYVASNVLKWYWWRFNGYGYFWGMLAGLVPALIFPLIFKETLELHYFPLLLLLSAIGCYLGSYLTKPTDEATLISFYRTVRPWGFWKPILQKVKARDPQFAANSNFKRDMVNVVVGTIWQTALVALPIYVVLLKTVPSLVCAAIIAVTTIFLKKNWLDTLRD
ncbi:MAG: hypothetical protein ALAOOOJD_03006 [bacterium]|nr:hypothetical protein [bacterium]